MRRNTRRSGISLVEVLISTLIAAMLMGVLVEVQSASARLSSKTMTLGTLENAATQLATHVAAELRWASPASLAITTLNGADRVEMVTAIDYTAGETVWSTPIVFEYEPSPVDTDQDGVANEGNLVRVQDGVRRVVGRNVELGSFTVTRDGETVIIELTVVGLSNDGERLTSRVALTTKYLNPGIA